MSNKIPQNNGWPALPLPWRIEKIKWRRACLLPSCLCYLIEPTMLAATLTTGQRRAVERRCASLCLSWQEALYLAQAADANDPLSILRVLGLNLSTLEPLRPRPWLEMAARTSGVSYRRQLSASDLSDILASGQAGEAWLPHLGQLLDEAPLQLVVMAVETVAQEQGLPLSQLWCNVHRLALQCDSQRFSHWREARAS